MDLDDAKAVLEVLVGRRSGMVTRTQIKEAACTLLDSMEDRCPECHRADQHKLDCARGRAQYAAEDARTPHHNHPTRDIKAPGKCPACDEYWKRVKKQ